MKKSVITMLFILIVLCFIYSSTDSQAAASIDKGMYSVSASSPSKSVIDIGESGTTEEDSTGNSNISGKTNNQVSNGTSDNNSIFKKSGREAINETMSGNDLGIMSEDYEFGDETLPDVDSEGFFDHVYNKMWEAMTGFQKIVSVISIMFFIASLIMVLVSCLGDKRRLGWYLFSLLISCLVFVGVRYAPNIVASFSNWFVD